MAATTGDLVKTTGTNPWVVNIQQAGTLQLATSKKYLDRNINIQTAKGSVTGTVAEMAFTPSGNGTYVPTVTAASISAVQGLTQTKPTGSTTYKTITLGGSLTKEVTFDTEAKITPTVTPGYVTSDDVSLTGRAGSVTIKNSNITTTPSAYYIVTKNLPSYTDSTLGQTSTLVDGASIYYVPHIGEQGQNAVDGIELHITLPEGYYNAQNDITYKIDNVIPDFTGTDVPAPASYILSTYKAYDQDGHVLTGTMANRGSFSTTSAITISDVATKTHTDVSLGVTSATWSDTDSSGIEITGDASGSVTITGSTGYYTAGERTLTAANATQQKKYLTGITLGEGKTLNTLAFAGSATSKAKIGTVSGSNGEITTYSASMNIASSSTGSSLTYKGTQIIKDTDLVRGAYEGKEVADVTNTNLKNYVFSITKAGYISATATAGSVAVYKGEYEYITT